MTTSLTSAFSKSLFDLGDKNGGGTLSKVELADLRDTVKDLLVKLDAALFIMVEDKDLTPDGLFDALTLPPSVQQE